MDVTEVKLMAVAQELGVAPEHVAAMSPTELQGAVRAKIATGRRERSEEEIAMQVVRVTLGGEEYDIRVRPMREDREWRRHIGKVSGMVLNLMMDGDIGKMTEGEMLARAMPTIMADGMDHIVEAFYAYSGLDRDEIESKAGSMEIYRAAMEVFRVFGAPFALGILKEMQAMQAMMA